MFVFLFIIVKSYVAVLHLFRIQDGLFLKCNKSISEILIVNVLMVLMVHIVCNDSNIYSIIITQDHIDVSPRV